MRGVEDGGSAASALIAGDQRPSPLLRVLTMPAANVITAPIPRPIRGAASADAKEKSRLIATAPAVCPNSRAVPCIPPAAPLLALGAEKEHVAVVCHIKERETKATQHGKRHNRQRVALQWPKSDGPKPHREQQTSHGAKPGLIWLSSFFQRITSANEGLKIGPGDRVLWVLPMAHHFAVSIVLYLYHGATTIIEETHLGEDLLRAGAEQKATVMYGSPVHYRQLVEAPDVAQWTTLRLAVATAAALDAATAQKFHTRFGLMLVQGLGIIELGLPVLNLAGAQTAPEALGLPLPAYQALLKDDAGQEPAQGEPGEICLRGPGMFDAYLDPWLPRAQVVDADGWFATGDLGRRDEAGRIYICGRKKTLINVGGMKVFPEEVEAVLDSHPKVQRAMVEARLHLLYGEVPVARYIASPEGAPTTMEIRNHCRAKLAGYKIPLMFSVVTELPLTASGKLKRV